MLIYQQTIIMSLNEEDVRIDLGQYAHHLRRFDEEVTDISKWFGRTKNGEVTVRRQADRVIELYREMHYLEQQARTLAGELELYFPDGTGTAPFTATEERGTVERVGKKKHQLEELSGKFQSEARPFAGACQVQERELENCA